MEILIVALFILGTMFSLASQIPVWLIGGGKPDNPNWKTYGLIAGIIWMLLLVLGTTVL